MKGRPKKSPREKDVTSRYMSGDLDDDRLDNVQRFTDKSKHFQRDKTQRTAQMRAADQTGAENIQTLPIGEVVQVYSVYCNIEHEGKIWLCVLRKTLSKVNKGDIVVGDLVRFRDLAATAESGEPEAVIEQILPRKTVLTRADSFKQVESHPIVANAQQMLIVASVREPDVKWGLIDRMLIAAKAGGLVPIICLNKVDLLDAKHADAVDVLNHYQSLGIQTLQTSIISNVGMETLREVLSNRVTVLAGHSGVGKSSLLGSLQPKLDVRIGAISGYTGKGRHTTTSTRRYLMDGGGQIIDTPGVKLFGLWGISRENLIDHFPDVAEGTAPSWRRESFERINESLIS